IPNLDPTVNFYLQKGHNTSPQTSSRVTGTNFLVSQYTSSGFSYQQGFLTGTNLTFNMQSQGLRQNSPGNDFNPSTTANAYLGISQNLLQGFGLAANKRSIRIAKNNRHVADLVFKQQVMATVANVINLYYDLVSFNENLKVQRQALELNQKLYEDNKRRASLGAIAPIDIVQAEAEMTAAQQQVTDAETQVLQQEMILKNALTRSGPDSLSVIDARIVPTTSIVVPEKETIRPVQDLIGQAIALRPEVEESRVGMDNSKISMQGTRSAALPVLQAFATLQNNALAGQVNTVPPVSDGSSSLLPPVSSTPNPFFLGGWGTVLGQLFSRNFPNYSAGFQLSIPIRNRAAQADLIRDQLTLREQQIQDRQLQNRIRMNVLNARIALQQARAAYDTSVKARMLQDQTLHGAQRKYQLGTSSFLDVVIVQRDMVTRRQAEVTALNSYIRARTNLELMIGEILQNHNISIEEAYSGKVQRPPTPLPVLDQK
ncbi:MAG TPA: TolC family protein, partial [Bryobacteraceae bacterium]|nr:TolC family protein [Bryobacteraceae bacterium]